MSLFLNEKEVSALLTMPLALDAVETAHRQLAQGKAVDVPRQRTRLPQSALHILQGALPELDAFGYKAYTSNRSGVRFMVYVFSAKNGNLRIALEANRLGMMRTAAASGVATNYLARKDAHVLGIFGAGWQAEGHIEAINAVRPLSLVKVFARNKERLAAFCARLSEKLGIRVVACASAEETVRESDIVSTVTTAATPLFEADWVSPGTHINGAGSNSLIRQEISEATIKRCNLIVVDSVETALKEAGDLLPLLEKGRLLERELLELGDIIVGKESGRATSESITLFESQGMAIQDIALAVRLQALAEEKGMGVQLPFGD